MNCSDFSLCHQSNTSGSHSLKNCRVTKYLSYHIWFSTHTFGTNSYTILCYAFVTKENLKQEARRLHNSWNWGPVLQVFYTGILFIHKQVSYTCRNKQTLLYNNYYIMCMIGVLCKILKVFVKKRCKPF